MLEFLIVFIAASLTFLAVIVGCILINGRDE